MVKRQKFIILDFVVILIVFKKVNKLKLDHRKYEHFQM